MRVPRPAAAPAGAVSRDLRCACGRFESLRESPFGSFLRICRNNFPDSSRPTFVAGLGGVDTAGPAAGGGAIPTSAGTGGGASPPSRAGRAAIPAIAATTVAATFPTVAHLICLPDTQA